MVAIEAPIGVIKERRVGARVLGLLAVSLNGMIVRALGQGPLRHSDLRRALGNPAETTLRGHLARLEELGAIQRRVRVGGPQFAKSELTGRGVDLLIATRALESWLSRAPEGPIRLGTVQAKGTVKALADAWDSTLLRALAARPLTLTQLARLISAVSYPALERRLAAMRATGLVKAIEDARATPYAITRWARQGTSPILCAARFERLHMENTPSFGRNDVEAAFLLATSIAALPPDLDGVCDLAVETRNEPMGRRVGVQVTIDRGRVVASVSRLAANPGTWVSGSPLAWLDAFVEGSADRLRLGGDTRLATGLLEGIEAALPLIPPNGTRANLRRTLA